MHSKFIHGLVIGVVGYWAVQHFTGLGNTGASKKTA